MHDSQLQSFATAARLGSFSKAAKEEHLAVQSFVQRINALENELGIKLFERNAQGVSLTAGGKEFEKSAREALRILKEGRMRALDASRRGATVIRAGVPWRVLPVLQRLLVKYQETHPSIVVECRQTSQENVLDDLAMELFDVTFLPLAELPPTAPIATQLIAEVDFAVVISPESELAKSDEINISDLVGKHVLCSYAKDGNAAWRDFFSHWPRDIDIVSEVLSGEEVIMKCLSDPNWAALFSSDTVALACPPLAARKLKDAPPFPIAAYFHTSASNEVTHLIDFIAQRYKEECKKGDGAIAAAGAPADSLEGDGREARFREHETEKD